MTSGLNSGLMSAKNSNNVSMNVGSNIDFIGDADDNSNKNVFEIKGGTRGQKKFNTFGELRGILGVDAVNDVKKDKLGYPNPAGLIISGLMKQK